MQHLARIQSRIKKSLIVSHHVLNLGPKHDSSSPLLSHFDIDLIFAFIFRTHIANNFICVTQVLLLLVQAFSSLELTTTSRIALSKSSSPPLVPESSLSPFSKINCPKDVFPSFQSTLKINDGLICFLRVKYKQIGRRAIQ